MKNSKFPPALQAIALVTLGYFGYSVSDLCSKLLQANHSTYQVLTYSGGVSALATGLWLLWRQGLGGFIPERPILHIIRSVLVVGAACFMVYAIRTLPLPDFYGIAFLVPFLAVILSVLVLKEKVGIERWAACAAGFLGVFFIAGPQFETLGMGMLSAFCGACCAAGNIIVLRKMKPGASPALYAFYPSLAICLVNLGMMVTSDTYSPFLFSEIPFLLCYAPGVILGICCISVGYMRAPLTAIVAPFLYTQMIWGITFGWIFFGHIPTITTAMGITLVIAAGLFSIWREYTLSRVMGSHAEKKERVS